MKKQLISAAVTLLITVAMTGTAFAGSWAKGQAPNDNLWWYDNGDNTWAANGWYWLDGNNDGIAECYYFDSNGWMYANTTTPDGYTVNADGAWVTDQVVQTKAVTPANNGVEYASDGVNKTVVDMLGSTRTENAAKYGEAKVRNSTYGLVYVTCEKAPFTITYFDSKMTNYPASIKATSFTEYDTDNGDGLTKLLFKNAPQGIDSQEEAADYLRSLGYKCRILNSNVYFMVGTYELTWYYSPLASGGSSLTISPKTSVVHEGYAY